MKTAYDNINGVWKESTKKQREDLLEGLGFNKDWANLDSLDEIKERGGGFVVRDLVKLWKKGFS